MVIAGLAASSARSRAPAAGIIPKSQTWVAVVGGWAQLTASEEATALKIAHTKRLGGYVPVWLHNLLWCGSL
jgi:hypothetical protein